MPIKSIRFLTVLCIAQFGAAIKPQPDGAMEVAKQCFLRSPLTPGTQCSALMLAVLQQNPEKSGTFMRLAFEQDLRNGNNLMTKKETAQRYLEVLKQSTHVQCANQLPLLKNLFGALEPDIIVQIASVDGGTTLAEMSTLLYATLGFMLDYGSRHEQLAAAALWSTLVETFSNALALSDESNMVASARIVAQATAQHAASLKKQLTTSSIDALMHNIAMLFVYLLNKESKNISAELDKLVAAKLAFKEPDRLAIMKSSTKRQEPSGKKRLSATDITDKIDHAFDSLILAQSVTGTPYLEGSVTLEAVLKSLEQPLRAIQQAKSTLLPSEYRAITHKLCDVKQRLLSTSSPIHRLDQAQKELLESWTHKQVSNIIEHLIRHHGEKCTQADMQAMVRCMLSNQGPLISETSNASLYLLCAQQCIEHHECPMAYDLLRLVLTVPTLNEDKALCKQYAKTLQNLIEEEVFHEDYHLLGNTIKHLLRPMAKMALRMKQDGLAQHLLMSTLEVLREHMPTTHNKNLHMRSQLNVLHIINPRILDAATIKDYENLVHDLKSLAEQPGINQVFINKLKEELEQRIKQPYLNNGFVRWLVGGLSRKRS